MPTRKVEKKKYFATLSEDGRFTGFYPSDVWATPPVGAVEITEDQYSQFFVGQSSNPCVMYKLVDGSMVAYTPELPPMTVPMSYAAAITTGLAVTSASDIMPPSTISLAVQQLSNLANVSLYILVNKRFPGGQDSLPLVLTDGSNVDVPSLEAWQEIATAAADFVALCTVALKAGMEPGGQWIGPSNEALIS